MDRKIDGDKEKDGDRKIDGKERRELEMPTAEDEKSTGVRSTEVRSTTEEPDREETDIRFPDTEELEAELKRTRQKSRRRATWKETLFTLIAVAAAAILVATLFLPVLRIHGTSMTPTLWDGNIVISLQGAEFKEGDIVAFYYNNRILVKRVIARAGDWVDIRSDGTVYVNDKELEEPYVAEKALGECDIKLPYQVPDKKFFLMGDHRSVSIDSRSKSIGCVAEEQIVGKLVFCIWPLSEFRAIGQGGK